ncbi:MULTISPECIES: formate dehydrogenase accessory protein FdhE [Neobacillus]|uniref:Formate dehydrogenase accessory protein FdhE n=1 Tax=Neobacillus citreus TaxID=2833578 RepID=A0A942T880_9BACI|nr:formate dehydrogenase accessory protein FdhE [Neobacillus citreus]MCH6268090.1 formate dehydrogenase accessory protein FdhE [Neobacillus citreus]
MIKSVVSKEYQSLQKEIVQLQEKWKQMINPDTVRPNLDKAALAAGVPAAALTAIDFEISLFLQWVEEITALLIETNPDLKPKLADISSMLKEETAIRWIEEAYSFNSVYFERFAEENGLEPWIPQFLAETALRPYLQLVAEKVQPEIDRAVPGSGCPVCGEPVRLAVLEDEGKKVCQCPRCLAHWNAKRLECSHCGNEDYQKIKFLTIEGDAVSQIQVCEECNGYIKIIDTRQYIEKPSAAMIDLNSIHLDFVAQENGFSSVGEKKVTN